MATKKEIIQLIALINTAFPNNKYQVTEQMVDMWYAMLGHYDLSTLKVALYKTLETCKFPPAIADIRAALRALVEQGLESAGEAWAAVDDAIDYSWCGNYEKCEKHVRPLVSEAVRLMGGWEAIEAGRGNKEVLRGQFTRIYNEARERAINTKLSAPVLLEAGNMLAGQVEREAVKAIECTASDSAEVRALVKDVTGRWS